MYFFPIIKLAGNCKIKNKKRKKKKEKKRKTQTQKGRGKKSKHKYHVLPQNESRPLPRLMSLVKASLHGD